MKINLSHPLWTHIPPVASLAVLIVALVSAGALPVDAPVHYGPGGQPDRYGSPWAAFALIVGLSIGFIILSVWLDELWARHERRKTFNYFALLDDITVGAMAGQGLGYLRLVKQAQHQRRKCCGSLFPRWPARWCLRDYVRTPASQSTSTQRTLPSSATT